MSETWKLWEGQVVDGVFPLLQYVCGSDRGAGEALMVEPEQGRLRRGHEQRGQCDRQNHNGDDEAHQTRRWRAATRPPRAARDRASVRRGPSSAMTAMRSASLIVVQAAISAVVRPQRRTKPTGNRSRRR